MQATHTERPFISPTPGGVQAPGRNSGKYHGMEGAPLTWWRLARTWATQETDDAFERSSNVFDLDRARHQPMPDNEVEDYDH
jgi:hypothetical protein